MKKQNKVKLEKRVNQGEIGKPRRPAKIDAGTAYGLTEARLSAMGGLLALVKFLDLVGFKEVFQKYYRSPSQKPALGCYRMAMGLIVLLFVGFARIGQMAYLRGDEMICGLLGVAQLPVVSTFWRYLFSLGRRQSRSLLDVSAVLRSRVWEVRRLELRRVSINIDTTVSTVYGQIEGARKGHNPKRRGKKALRPVLMFIEETREYLLGAQRRGETMSDKEVAMLIRQIRRYLPSCVKRVLIRGDAEFIGPLTVQACEDCNFKYIFGNKSAKPVFREKHWYRHRQHQYNQCLYAPLSWDKARRWVVMRIKEAQRDERQLHLLETGYMHRCFVTNLKGQPHQVIALYDQRASVEAAIKEAQQEGILAIPSRRFWSNHAFFQLVMLTYHIWRWMKLLQVAQHHEESTPTVETPPRAGNSEVDHTIRIARLKLLFVPARIVRSHRCTTVKYSVHDARAEGLVDFMAYLDKRRSQEKNWREDVPLTQYKKAG